MRGKNLSTVNSEEKIFSRNPANKTDMVKLLKIVRQKRADKLSIAA